ncbi:hypothetical protein JXB31_01510 [Candidatus Woesearchaeota archaeon]|nr:hypothetical protein [Candidatus Woesearchaeota archaeon]
MARGRPIGSEIRQNVVDILYCLGEGYGYDIYRIYKQVFPKCTSEVIYYHLRKGAKIGEFQVNEIKKERGDYSWGSVAEKIYYVLGPEAKPRINNNIKNLVDKIKSERKCRK